MEELLLKFLERHFTVIFDGKITVLDNSYDEKISYYSLLEIITKIFSLGCSNEEFRLITNKWFKDKSVEFVGGLDKFLEECVIVLGSTNWEVKHKIYGTIDLNAVELYPIDSPMKTHHEAVKAYVGKWYDEEVIKVSEKMMGINENDIW
jgi:hypothetical protein